MEHYDNLGDFSLYYAGSSLLLKGLNPWNRVLFESEVRELFAVAGNEYIPGFPYFPWSTWLWGWFALFTPTTSLWIVRFIILALCFIATKFLIRDLRTDSPILSGPSLFAILLLFPPIFKCAYQGHLAGGAMLLSIVSLNHLIKRDNDKWIGAGLAASVLLVKIHLFILLFVSLTYLGSQSGRKELVLGIMGFLLGCILQLGASLALSFEIFRYYADSSLHLYYEKHLSLPMPTIGAIILSNRHGIIAYVFLLLGAILFSLRFLKRQRPASLDIFTPALISVLSAPYGWIHDYVILYPLWLKEMSHFGKRKALFITVLAFLFSFLLWSRPFREQEFVMIPILALIYSLIRTKGREIT